MTINVEFWHLVSLLLSFLGCCFGFAKLLAAQFEGRLDLRFKAHDDNYRRLHDDIHNAKELAELARKLVIELQIALPNEYHRREDAVRSETVNSARWDAINAKLDKMILMNGK